MDVSTTPKLFHNHQLIVNPLNLIDSLVLERSFVAKQMAVVLVL